LARVLEEKVFEDRAIARDRPLVRAVVNEAFKVHARVKEIFEVRATENF
jgi:hypothetical protein